MAQRRTRRRPAAPRRRRGRWLGCLLLWLSPLLVGGLLAATGWVLWLDATVSGHFEGKRWQVPARVYARALDLHPNAPISAARFAEELERLGYRAAPAVGGAPGIYSRAGERFHVVTRPFRYHDGEQPALRLELQFSGQRLATVRDLTSGAAVEWARLDPLEIATLHPGHNEDRILVRLDEVPPELVATLLAVEDRHFYRHRGIDWRGIARAAFANLRAGRTVQGGSTLTQQLVKNFYLSHDRTLWRKANEAVMALLLERRYGKEAILEAYLNEVYLGQDGRRAIHGFGLASRYWFGRPLAELGAGEMALLVGMLRGPSVFDPQRHPERARSRRNTVLGVMLREGILSETLHDHAVATPLGAEPRRTGGGGLHPAFIDLVRRQLRSHYHERDLTSEGLRLFTTLDPHLQAAAEQALTTRLAQIEARRGLPSGTLEGAVVVLDPVTGEVQALVGGRLPRLAGFNRALDAERPIGSLVKPAIYLTALERGYTLASRLDDRAITLQEPDGRSWSPRNFDGGEHGPVLLYQALARSYNLAAVRLGLELGVEDVLRTLGRLGVERRLRPYPSQLLGAASLSPFEVAVFYQPLANGGVRIPPRALRAVTAADGTPLASYPPRSRKVAEPGPVAVLDAALQAVVREGTARSLAEEFPRSWPLAGKTGTSNDRRDAWFAGYAGDRLVVVWVGADDNRPVGLTGSSGALPVWRDLFVNVSPPALPRLPRGEITELWVDPTSGRLSAAHCAGAVRLPFIVGTGPSGLADCHAGLAPQDQGQRVEGDTPSRWWQRFFTTPNDR